ncbi:MAG TPA: AAA family ATPase, partial [Pyrinomonadaceae bacterium]
MSRSRLVTPTRKKSLAVGLLIILAGLVVVGISYFTSPAPSTARNINYTQLRELAAAGAVAHVVIEGEAVTVTMSDGSAARAVVVNQAAQQEVAAAFANNNAQVEYRVLQPGFWAVAINWMFPVLMLLAFGLIGWRLYASVGGTGDFQLNDVSGNQPVTFDMVAGVDEAKSELAETIEFLRDPVKFGRLGGRAPRGVLLSGPPGTGKTLLARAAATEAKVPFLSVSGSSFQEKFAGLGAARVRRLFARARKLSPCVIFIDEIDALGRRRGRGQDSASADQDQTLNQLLIEMDGFEQMNGVVVIASTNRPDILDTALTRPGRFDREITVNLADLRGRHAILKVHAEKLTLEETLELEWIARGTPGFSGADLANL